MEAGSTSRAEAQAADGRKEVTAPPASSTDRSGSRESNGVRATLSSAFFPVTLVVAEDMGGMRILPWEGAAILSVLTLMIKRKCRSG